MLEIKDLEGKTDGELKAILKNVIFLKTEELDWSSIFAIYIDKTNFSVNSRNELGREIFELFDMKNFKIDYKAYNNNNIYSNMWNFNPSMYSNNKIESKEVEKYITENNGLISSKNFFSHMHIKIFEPNEFESYMDWTKKQIELGNFFGTKEPFNDYIKIEQEANSICIKLGYFGDLLDYQSLLDKKDFHIEYVKEKYVINDKNKVNRILEIIFDIIKVAINPSDEPSLDEITDFFSDTDEEIDVKSDKKGIDNKLL